MIVNIEIIIKNKFVAESGEENGFVYEVAEVVRCIENGLLESPICPHQMTIDAARITSEVLHLNP